MFHTNKRSQDLKKNTTKFLEWKRDSHARLRALKVLIEQLLEPDLKTIFSEHPLEVFYVFQEEFTNFENSIKSKSNSKAKEDLEGLLSLLEKIFILLPEKIHQRWHYNSIGLIMRKLLHSGNAYPIREIAVRLFMLWLQILQDNVEELVLALYGSLVPGFPSVISKIDLKEISRPKKSVDYIVACINGIGYSHAQTLYNCSLESETEWCVTEGCTPLMPPTQGEKMPSTEEFTKKCLAMVLDYMTRRMLDIQWTDKRSRESGFYHLFLQFKRFYLPYIFPLWSPEDRIYTEADDILPVPLTENKELPATVSPLMQYFRKVVLCWIIACICRGKDREGKFKGTVQSMEQEQSELESSVTSAGGVEATGAGPPTAPELPSATNASQKNYEAMLCEVADIVRSVLYSTKENVLVVLEIFRQSFLMPLSCAETMSRVLSVYQEWFKIKAQDRPLFMLEAKHASPNSYLLELANEDDDDDDVPPSPIYRSPSYKEAVRGSSQAFFVKVPVENVRGGFQANLRFFIAFTGQVFFVTPQKEFLNKHVDICRKVMKMFRNIVLEMRLNTLTWRQLLTTLLKVTAHLLPENPPEQPMSTLGGQMAGYVLQTLFVTWIRASLQVHLSDELWNSCLRTLSPLTSWDEVITEWSNTVSTLTRVMSRTVYGIDLQDPPLEHLSEQKKLRVRGREKMLAAGPANAPRPSFSQGWSSYGGPSDDAQDRQSDSAEVSGAKISGLGLPRPSSEPGVGTTRAQTGAALKYDVSAGAFVRKDDSRRILTASAPSVGAWASDSDLHAPSETGVKRVTLASMANTKNSISTDSYRSGGSVFESNIPALSIDSDSGADEESDAYSSAEQVCTYHELGSKDNESSSSSINLLTPNAVGLAAMSSFLSESSQNLLANVESYTGSADDDLDDPEETPSALTSSGPVPRSESLNSMHRVSVSTRELLEVPLQGHGNHLSVASSQDLINFEDSVRGSGKLLASDAQSIDSRLFTVIDNEGFSELGGGEEHAGSGSNILESPDEELVDEIDAPGLHQSESVGHKVRFVEDLGQKIVDEPQDVSSAGLTGKARQRSVIEGGLVEGWTPVSSVVLWRRVLGILGDVNKIRSPQMHAKVFKQLIGIWTDLETVKRNQGISLDKKSTPPPPELTPPLFFCAAWCFDAMAPGMATDHKPGRVLAYKLMCMMSVRNHGVRPTEAHMIHFYRLLHAGLTGNDQDVINAVLSQCSPFYTLDFEGSSLLILGFISACSTIVSTQYMQHPRKEAVTLLGSLVCLPHLYAAMPIYQPGVKVNEGDRVSTGKDLREKILFPLLKASRSDPSCRARCVALSCLGVFIVESLIHVRGHARICECLALIVTSLEFRSLVVSNVALDVLWSLSFYYDLFAAFDPEIVLKIIEAICQLASSLLTAVRLSTSEMPSDETPEFLSRLLLCLLDWVMCAPRETLLKNRNDREEHLTYLGLVVKTFKKACDDKLEIRGFERRRSLNINQIFVGESRPIRLDSVHNDLGMDDAQGITDEDESDFMTASLTQSADDMLELTGRYCLNQLVNFYQHFPFNTGAVRPTSLVTEPDDGALENVDELSAVVLNCSNIQFFLLNRTTLLTAIEFSQQSDFSLLTHLRCAKSITRLILRDLTGKYCWDCSELYMLLADEGSGNAGVPASKTHAFERRHSRNLSLSTSRSCPTWSSILPTLDTVNEAADRVDQLLRYVGYSSPECLQYAEQPLNVPAPAPAPLDCHIQSLAMSSVLKQQNEEEHYVPDIGRDSRIMASKEIPRPYEDPTSPFHGSRRLLHQLGCLTWERRNDIELLTRSDRLLSDIKHLDNRPSRETHKIAMFYVAPGQEDKQSILLNATASQRFEDFIAGMAWEVDLATHTGFLGGLETNLSTGKTAPYYATHSLEAIFHVSTRIPGSDEESLKTKLRHLGNDEVHIVWSEHTRDFRRGIINTDFADVMIIIYPLKNDLFRIQIDRNPKIPPFGPLFDGAIVDWDMLPLLVRSTAINGGRAKRRTIPLYHRHFEERARCIREIAKSRVRCTTFEEFATHVFAPTISYHDQTDTENAFRTFSVPARPTLSFDSSGSLKLLDMPDTFRYRAGSASLANHSRPARSTSNTSLNQLPLVGEDPPFSDAEKDSYKDRKKSISRRLKKKQPSVDGIDS